MPQNDIALPILYAINLLTLTVITPFQHFRGLFDQNEFFSKMREGGKKSRLCPGHFLADVVVVHGKVRSWGWVFEREMEGERTHFDIEEVRFQL